MIYFKKITKVSLLIMLFFCLVTPQTRSFWHNESIQSAKNKITTTILPFIQVTAIGENNHLNLTSTNNKTAKIITHYLPLVIIGRSQSQSQLILTYRLASQTKKSSLKTTAYSDGSFTFSLPTLDSQKNYLVTITSQSGIKPEAKISFTIRYQPLATNYHQIAPQKTTIYYQSLLPKKRFLTLVFSLNLLFLPLLIFLFRLLSNKFKLFLLNPDMSLAKNKQIVIFSKKDGQEIPKVYKSNSQGIIKLANGCYHLTNNQSNQEKPKLPANLFNPYIVYQNGIFCIKTNQIFYQDQVYSRAKIKGIIKILES